MVITAKKYENFRELNIEIITSLLKTVVCESICTKS